MYSGPPYAKQQLPHQRYEAILYSINSLSYLLSVLL